MLATDVLKHLQSQFPGQLVLYAPDLAQVLGKSEKALSHLITRGQLPFQVKSLGGKKCVDIFQVADWLATDEGGAGEAAASTTTADAGQSDVGSRGRRPRSGSGRSGIGAKLMELRYEAARTLVVISESASGADVEFLVTLAAHLAKLHGVPSTTFVVKAVWLEAFGYGASQGEISSLCTNDYEVRSAIDRLKHQLPFSRIAGVTVKRGRKTLYHAFRIDTGDWRLTLDALTF